MTGAGKTIEDQHTGAGLQLTVMHAHSIEWHISSPVNLAFYLPSCLSALHGIPGSAYGHMSVKLSSITVPHLDAGQDAALA